MLINKGKEPITIGNGGYKMTLQPGVPASPVADSSVVVQLEKLMLAKARSKRLPVVIYLPEEVRPEPAAPPPPPFTVEQLRAMTPEEMREKLALACGHDPAAVRTKVDAPATPVKHQAPALAKPAEPPAPKIWGGKKPPVREPEPADEETEA